MTDKQEPKIGETCKSSCSAIGRYIGNGNVLFVSAMNSDLTVI